jgi:hypothetical protein
MQTINITAHTEDPSQIEVVKAVMKALKIKFEISKEKPYNPEFVDKIRQSEKEIAQGKTQRVKKEDLKQLLGL